MPDCDLKVMDDRVNRSREEFLHALKEYDPNVAKQIIREFVSTFLDEKETRWADTTRDLANQIVEQNDRFGGMVGSSLSKLEHTSLNFQLAVQHLTIEIMRIGMEVFGPLPTGVPLVEGLSKWRESSDKAHKAFIAAGEDAQNNACKIGEELVIVQRLATDLLLLRTVTLRAFKSRNLGVSFEDIIERLRGELKDYAKSEGRDEAVKIILEKMHEILGIVVEQAPVIRILKIAEKIGKILGPKEVKPDSTNELNRLIDLMNKENALYHSLDTAYQHLMDELDKVNHLDLSKAA
jgi:hypothetical protein